jgi:hypothetical protein
MPTSIPVDRLLNRTARGVRLSAGILLGLTLTLSIAGGLATPKSCCWVTASNSTPLN